MRQFLANLIQDLRFTFRQSSHRPGLAVASVMVLALGIGGSTAVFSILYQVLLRPLPYPDSERLLFIHNRFPKSQVSTTGVSGFDYAEVSRHKDIFSNAGIFYWNDLTMTGLGEARHINVVNASASLFDVLGVRPRLGRTFNKVEDRRGAAGTALLSDELWRSAFAADPNVLGRILYLNGIPYTVIGVMPRSFQFPSRETQLWIPVALPANEFTIQGGRLEKWLHMVARLAPGVGLERANSALETIGAPIAARYPSFYPAKDGWRFTLRQLADEQTEGLRRWLYLAFGAVISVLLIACINVSGLLLIRGAARSGEIAVRRAIGATKSRIIWQMLTETAVLVFVSCVLALLVSVWALHLVDLYGPMAQPIPIHMQTLLFALVLMLLSTILAGLLPAMLAAQLPADQTFRSSATRTTTGASGLRNGIVAAQIAFAVGLIFTATQLNRSFLNLTRVPVGFDQHHLWTGAITLPSHAYIADQSWNTRFFQPLLKRLNSLPGVQAASGANAVPFNPSGTWTEEFRLPERPGINPHPEAQIGLAFPGYFETMRIPLLKGRTFTDRDRAGALPVAVIDQELAHRYFPSEEPVGKFIASGGAVTPARIIGVVGTVHNGDLGGPREPEVYYPELQERAEATYLVLRMDGDLDPSSAVRQAIAKLNPDVALYDAQFMDARVASSLKMRRFISFLLNGLAVTGLLLALIGLYGSLAHLVELRRREIGIRVAIGATQSQLICMILLRAGMILASGLSVGVVAAAFAGRAIRAQLFGVTLTDQTTWVSVLGLISIVSLLSALLPAWRAASIDPASALRNE